MAACSPAVCWIGSRVHREGWREGKRADLLSPVSVDTRCSRSRDDGFQAWSFLVTGAKHLYHRAPVTMPCFRHQRCYRRRVASARRSRQLAPTKSPAQDKFYARNRFRAIVAEAPS